MKTKLSKLFETIKTNKTKTTIIAVAAFLTVAAVGTVCALNTGDNIKVSDNKPSFSASATAVSEGTTTSESNSTENTKETSSTSETSSLNENSSTTSMKTDSSKEIISSEETIKKEPVHTHSYKSKVVKPTCTTDGYTKYTCECGKSYTDNNKSKLGHAYGSWKVTKEATTSRTGLKVRKCSRCAKEDKETISKKKQIIYTYTDGTTGTVPKDGATYEIMPGVTRVVSFPKDAVGRLDGSICEDCGKKVGVDNYPNSCEKFTASYNFCSRCGGAVEPVTCHTCIKKPKKTTPWYCTDCGRIQGDGSNGTCRKYSLLGKDMKCPLCKAKIPARECHTCKK